MKSTNERLRALHAELKKLRQQLSVTHTEQLALSLPQAAQLLGRSERTLQRMIRSGLLRTSTICGVPMIPSSELKRVAAPVVQASVSVVEKVARARSLFKSKRPSRRTQSAPRNTRHPQD